MSTHSLDAGRPGVATAGLSLALAVADYSTAAFGALVAKLFAAHRARQSARVEWIMRRGLAAID